MTLWSSNLRVWRFQKGLPREIWAGWNADDPLACVISRLCRQVRIYNLLNVDASHGTCVGGVSRAFKP